MNRIVVLDSVTPWIRHLFAALPAGWTADFLGPRTIGLSPKNWWAAWRDRSPERDWVPVPGWTRAYRFSTATFAHAVRRRLARGTPPQAIVHTIPWTAGLVPQLPECPHIYRPHDYFGQYQWDQESTTRLEREMQTHCRFSVPVTECHAHDLRSLGPAPVHTLRNGVLAKFIDRLRGPKPPRPNDLPADRPVVGCIGQINSSYDLDLIAKLADAMPDIRFVYIGPIFHERDNITNEVKAALGRANTLWLGPKPYEHLPNYLCHFSVCLNPMKISSANHRRSQLRLFDYLASDLPILSAALDDAQIHGDQIIFGHDLADFVLRLKEILNGRFRTDLAVRRAYIDAQTWEVRGQSFVDLLTKFGIQSG